MKKQRYIANGIFPKLTQPRVRSWLVLPMLNDNKTIFGTAKEIETIDDDEGQTPLIEG